MTLRWPPELRTSKLGAAQEAEEQVCKKRQQFAEREGGSREAENCGEPRGLLPQLCDSPGAWSSPVTKGGFPLPLRWAGISASEPTSAACCGDSQAQSGAGSSAQPHTQLPRGKRGTTRRDPTTGPVPFAPFALWLSRPAGHTPKGNRRRKEQRLKTPTS